MSSPFRRWPVRWRIAGTSAALTFVILLCFALIVGRLVTNRLNGDFHEELQNTANELAIEGQLTGNIRAEAMVGEGVVRVVDEDGNPHPDTADPPQFGPPEPGVITDVGEYEVASEQVFTNAPGIQRFVQYAETRENVEATIDRLWLLLGGGVLGGSALALLAGLAVAGRAMRPIADLTDAAREIATTRDPSRRLPMPESEDEVAKLALTLGEMLRQLDAAQAETEQMIQAQRDFVADASHELRTPLTSILANLELLEAGLAERGADADSDEAQIVAGALGSSRRMRRLVSDLLLLARADAGRAGPRRSCDLVAIARAVLDEVRPVAGEHELVADLPEKALEVDGNPDELHRLALNLIENAVRHTPSGTTVNVALARDADNAVLEVEDDGPGLPDGSAAQLFSRFVRGGGPADVVGDSGTGLGLAIVKAVTTSHGGDVEAGATPSGGARFTVRLPLTERSKAPPRAALAG